MQISQRVASFGFMLSDIAWNLNYFSHQMVNYLEPWPLSRQQKIRPFRNVRPIVEDAAFIAENASIMGNVVLGHDSCVFYSASVRNQHTKIRTVIGDNSVLLDRVSIIGMTTVGRDCFIGVGCSLDCCEVHDNAHIGAGSCLGLGCVVENGAIVAPGSVVPKDFRVPAGEIWAGAGEFRKVGVVTDAQASEMNYQVHDAIMAGHAHRESFEKHLDENRFMNLEWLQKKMEQVEAHHQKVQVATATEPIPVEAKKFLKPRASSRNPELAHSSSAAGNFRGAPWVGRAPDWVSNV